MTDKTKLLIKVDRSAEIELSDRAVRMMPSNQPLPLKPKDKSVHFLRGVASKASFILPGFYMLLASDPSKYDACSIKGYPGSVFQNYINHSSLNNISLACRKVFDHAGKGSLTGGVFAKTNDETLKQHAEYWADLSGNSFEDSYKALIFLRSFFRRCAKSNSDLLKQKTTLGRRIALIKQHADSAASHFSLEDYEFTIVDVAHLVASLSLVGEIIRSFDNPDLSSSYFNDIDSAAYIAAKELFPTTESIRLFESINVEQQAKSCWKYGEEDGLHMLLEQIPFVTSYF